MSILGQFQLRGDTAANWAAANPILLAREVGIETDTDQLKIGNGIDPWNMRPYGGLVGPQGPQGIQGEAGPQGPTGATGADSTVPGPQGIQGFDGWEPVLAVQSDGDRRVLRLVDWVGGGGTKPAVPANNYIGPAGFTNLAGATDIRGAQGLQGIQGETGLQGLQGVQGIQGEVGPQGPAGVAPPGTPTFVGSVHTTTQANTTVTPADLTGQVFTVPPGKTLSLKGVLLATGAAATTGIFYGFRVTQGAGANGNAQGSWRAEVALTSAAAATGLADGDVINAAAGATVASGVLGSATVAGNNVADIDLIVKNNSTNVNTTVALQFRSEVAGSAVTAQIGTSAAGVIG